MTDAVHAMVGEIRRIHGEGPIDAIALSPQVIADTLGAILKYQDDIAKLQGSEAKRLLDEARASLEPA